MRLLDIEKGADSCMELAFFILGVCSFPVCTPGLYSGSGSFLYLGILSWCTRFEAWVFATAFNRNRYILWRNFCIPFVADILFAKDQL